MLYDILIIGGGPAGLAAAIYGLRANKSVLVIEKQNFGGQIIESKNVVNYPGFKEISGMELGSSMYEQAKELGMEEKYGEVLEIKKEASKFIVKTKKEEFYSKTIILATGSKTKMLNLENERNLIGKGISYCATCDGAFFKDGVVAVIGGGNTAIEDCLYLANLCQKVYLIHRRDTFRAEAKKVELLKTKKNVEFYLDSVVEKLIGKDSLEEIVIQNVKNNKKTTLKVDGLFVAIGRVANTTLVENLINLASDRTVEADDSTKTNIEGLFVAGDVRQKKIRQLTTATADGTIAAMMAINYLENN